MQGGGLPSLVPFSPLITFFCDYSRIWHKKFLLPCYLAWIGKGKFYDDEARTLLRLGVSRCQTRIRVRVGHRHVSVSDTDTYNYTELCQFFELLSVWPCRCQCFIDDNHLFIYKIIKLWNIILQNKFLILITYAKP
jgi:hypothetical protein